MKKNKIWVYLFLKLGKEIISEKLIIKNHKEKIINKEKPQFHISFDNMKSKDIFDEENQHNLPQELENSIKKNIDENLVFDFKKLKKGKSKILKEKKNILNKNPLKTPTSNITSKKNTKKKSTSPKIQRIRKKNSAISPNKKSRINSSRRKPNPSEKLRVRHKSATIYNIYLKKPCFKRNRSLNRPTKNKKGLKKNLIEGASPKIPKMVLGKLFASEIKNISSRNPKNDKKENFVSFGESCVRTEHDLSITIEENDTFNQNLTKRTIETIEFGIEGLNPGIDSPSLIKKKLILKRNF